MCKWTTGTGGSLSANTSYWIPTGWPARTVYCYVYCDAAGVVVTLPDWSPTEELALHLVVTKTAAGTIVVQTDGGLALLSLTTSNAAYREIFLRFVPSIGWVSSYYTMAANAHVVSGSGRANVQDSLLPEGGRFAPSTTNPVAP